MIGKGEMSEDVRAALKRNKAVYLAAIGVSCELAPTHIAGLPVAVNIQCHCVRCEKEAL